MQISRFFSVMLVMASFIACSDNGSNDDNITMCPSSTYLRFVSPSGTNILDSLGVIKRDENDKIIEVDDDIIETSGIRVSDGESLFIANWMTGTIIEHEGIQTDETCLGLHWNDPKACFTEKDRPWEYDDVYDIQLYSPQVFGDDNIHRLKWYIHVTGQVIKAYKCEYDGQEVNLDNDPRYNRFHTVDAILTITCGER